MDCADPLSEDGTTMAPQASAEQRRKHGLNDDNNQSRQGKRGKYTSVACEECKKRKSKCIPAGESGCKRCLEGRLACIYTRAPPQLVRDKAESHHEYRQSLHLAQQNQRIESLSSEVTQIRQQLADLTGAVNRLGEAKQALPGSLRPLSPAASQGAPLVHSPTSHSRRDNVSQQPQFMGPTRPAFGLVMGERALTRMGIPVCDSVPPSGAQSPTTSSHDPTCSAVAREYWASCSPDEVRRLLEVWHDEVEMVYPFIDLRDQVSQSPELIERFRTAARMENQHFGVDTRDIDLFKVALSTANVCDSGGKNELSTAIVDSVESNISRLSKSNTNLKSIQLLMMLSIYYFHSGEDLLSWRTIGLAAREALEMGLHRKESTLDRFRDQLSRAKAARVFWCLYVLDRRWSFGAGLPFAISERDIDPDLPEPDAEFAYLRCMVNYGRLNSEIWDAIPPFGSGPQSIPEDTANSLEARALDWLESIPTELQLRHPRLGLAPQSQPAGLQRLRTLLYLRGNHTRSLIHRNHILDGPRISGNLQGAWLVVDIAMDSIQVLMHLSATTDIYKRQQNAFNYFLLSALAIIVLAVCNAPEIFTGPCRKSFLDAVELVRGFSRHSNVSMRLWKTINGILPRLGRLGLQRSEGLSSSSTGKTPAVVAAPGQFGPSLGHSLGAELEPYMPGVDPHSDLVSNANFMCESPDLSQMGTDLLSLFDAFGHRYAQPADYYSANAYALNDFEFLSEIGGEVSRRFEGLI